MPDFPVKTSAPGQPEYPNLLAKLKKPPNPLYYRGALPKSLFNISFVGARKMTPYGRQAVEYLIAAFNELPVCIVSGMAFGVDAQSHRAALENNLQTIAVLGSGIDDSSIYPRAHRGLAYQILRAGGALISHFPPGTKAQDWHFPQRNEIISGMSKAIVVVEAAEKSGALITADFALHQNREVFAVPGSIFERSAAGTNNLIKTSGAKLISSAEDIINEFPALLRFKTRQSSAEADQTLSEIQRQILSKISAQPASFSDILLRTNLPANVLGANLILLEISNKITRFSNNCYALNLTKRKPYG